MPVTIPLRPDLLHYEMQVSLDETVYTLELQWSGREEAWYLNVRTEAGEPIYSGIKVVVDHPLGMRCRDVRFPPGMLVAHDTTGARQDPGIEDLGARVQLLYHEAAELPVDTGAL